MKENGATSGHPLAQDPLQQECGGADPLQAAQAALFQAEANYRDLVERLPLIIYIDEPNASSSNIYTSPQTAAILGYTPEEWASDPHFFPAILHPDDRERVLAEHARTLATGEPLRTEYRLIRRDGQEVCVRDEAVLIHDEDGNAVRLQGYMLDISEAKQRETALLESAAIVGSSFDAVVGRTPEGLVTSWNAAAERIFGYGADEMIGRSITILAPPERADELDIINDTLRRGDAAEPFETVRVRKDGTRLEVESTVSPIVDASGRIIGVSAISRDISARKRSEALAEGQAQLLRLIAAGAPLTEVLDRLARFVEEQSGEALTSILLLDRDGLHLRHGASPSLPAAYNDAIDGIAIGPDVGSCGTAAYQRESVMVSDIATDPRWSDYRELALSNGLRACWSTPIFATDGTLLATFAMYYHEPCDALEHDLQIVEMATQIAGIAIERGRSEEALRTSESRYRDLFENASDMIATVDLDWNITGANSALAAALGYTPEELLRMNLAQLLPPESHQLAHSELTRKLSQEVEVTTYEHDFVARDGQRVAVEVKTNVIWQDGKPTGVEAIARDMSKRKHLEEQLRQAQKMEAVGQLAGGVAHDFNNMMCGVIGYSELVLARLEEDHPARPQVAEIKRAGERASELTRQLLAFSRKQVLRPRPLDLNAIVAETESLLERLIGEDIKLVSDLEPGLDTVLADPGQLEQVIVNLAVNARDAMPTGGKLTVETRNVELDASVASTLIHTEPGAYVRLSVSDEGTGMDAQTRARIFDPFFTTKAEGSGTGLGLSTVYGIIKQSGGNISVDTEPGRGTTFKIYLPSALTPAAGRDQPAGGGADAPGGSETVLLVEDEEIVRHLEREVLEGSGYTVLEAQSAEHAVQLCMEHRGTIHLLLTDVVMPQMSGPELAEQLAPIRPAMKVLYASGYPDNAITHRGVLESGTAFLPKPLTPGSLTHTVRAVLDHP